MSLFKLLYRVFFTLYAFVGIFYFKWSIFPIVFLFWTENMVQFLFLVIISYSSAHVSIPNKAASAYTLLSSKFFINMIYFVFLTFGWGFISLITGKGNEESFGVLASIFTVLMGKDSGFNIALGLCLLRETWLYLRDFHIKPIFTAERPFVLPDTFGYKEITLHLSLVLGMGGSLLVSKWLTQDDTPTFLSNYGFIIFFLVLKLAVEVFIFLTDKPEPEKNSPA